MVAGSLTYGTAAWIGKVSLIRAGAKDCGGVIRDPSARGKVSCRYGSRLFFALRDGLVLPVDEVLPHECQGGVRSRSGAVGAGDQ